MKLIYVRPADGLSVLDERTGRPLPADGLAVPETPYVRRRLIAGDVLEVPAKKSAPAKPAQEA